MANSRTALALLTAGLLGAGCSTGVWFQNRLAAAGLGLNDGVVIILDQGPKGKFSRGLERNVARCVERAIRKVVPAVRAVPAEAFRRVAFPTPLDPARPRDETAWEHLLADITFQHRIAPLAIRYIIAVSAAEGKGSNRLYLDGAAQGGQGGGVAFFLVGAKWEVWSQMRALVLDPAQAHKVGIVFARARGESVGGGGLGVVWILPILFPFGKASFPEGVACRKLGEGVAAHLMNGSPANP